MNSLSAVPFNLFRRTAKGEVTHLLALTARFEKVDDESWAGTCVELGTSAIGDTLEEVLDALREAILMQIQQAEQRGFLEEFLEDRNVRMQPVPQGQSGGWAYAGSGAR